MGVRLVTIGLGKILRALLVILALGAPPVVGAFAHASWHSVLRDDAASVLRCPAVQGPHLRPLQIKRAHEGLAPRPEIQKPN